jgi:hypothetical protein
MRKALAVVAFSKLNFVMTWSHPCGQAKCLCSCVRVQFGLQTGQLSRFWKASKFGSAATYCRSIKD